MKILVLNCGSSSVKYQLLEMDDESVVAKGQVERIGKEDAILKYAPSGRDKVKKVLKVEDHNEAISLVLSTLMDSESGVISDKSEIAGIGHRVVHGGSEFSGSMLVDDNVVEGIRACIPLGPLHNPHNLKGIEVCEELLSGIPQTAVFDTAFHQTLPEEAYLYAIPKSLYRKYQIRRYGFHGTSHKYVAQQAADYLGKPIEDLKIITCHLGNGASIAAVDGGKCVETSMGFTPLEGLVMGTRCGDIDPAILPYLGSKENLSLMQLDSLLNSQSGMLGLTEDTNDFRDIEDGAIAGVEKHVVALDVYNHRIKKYIGSYMAILGGVDAIVFTAGVGERSPYCRIRILAGMEKFGIGVDSDKNDENAFDIGTGDVKVLVVPTDEELAIARDTKEILENL